MNEYRPLRAVLFYYEVFRVLLLAGLFVFFSPLEGVVKGGVFPFLAYVTPNALFPIMALFLWARLGEFRVYLPLYVAGKVIAVVAFYAWGLFNFRPALELPLMGLERESIAQGIALLSGGFVLSLGDALSIFGGWMLHNRIKSADSPAAEARVVEDTGGNGGLS
jgi:hypothetical protein